MTMIKIDLTGAGAEPEIPVLRDQDGLELPEGAALNPDGSVTLTFEDPATVVFRPMGGAEAERWTVESLTLQRIKGRELRKVLAAKAARQPNLLLSLSSGISEAKLALLYPAMAAPDLSAARMVLNALIDTGGDGLQAQAEQRDDGTILLPLREAATDGDEEIRHELVFKKLRADALIAMQNAKDLLSTALHKATGLSLKAASGLIDDMDAADVNAAQRVIGFLSGIGRRTGG